MRVLKKIASLAMLGILVAGCGGQEPTENGPITITEASQEIEEPGHEESGERTDLPALTLDGHTVSAWHVGPPTDGHFNFVVDGGEVAAVRAWIGDEAATRAFVGKAEWEDDHYCAHLEVASPLPADAKAWVELETPEGKLLKGSMDLEL